MKTQGQAPEKGTRPNETSLLTGKNAFDVEIERKRELSKASSMSIIRCTDS